MTERCKRNPCCGDYLDCKPPPQFNPRESYEDYKLRNKPAKAPTSGSEAGGEPVAWRAVANPETRMGTMVHQIKDMLIDDADSLYGKGRWTLQELGVLATPAPSPAGGVREAFRAGLDAAAEYIERIGDYGHEHAAYEIRSIEFPVYLSPATAARGGLSLPDEMTPAIKDALSVMLWNSGSIARAYRACGFTIPNKAEEEQAFVLWRTLRFAIEHGENWRQAAQDELNSIRSALASPDAKRDTP